MSEVRSKEFLVVERPAKLMRGYAVPCMISCFPAAPDPLWRAGQRGNLSSGPGALLPARPERPVLHARPGHESHHPFGRQSSIRHDFHRGRRREEHLPGLALHLSHAHGPDGCGRRNGFRTDPHCLAGRMVSMPHESRAAGKKSFSVFPALMKKYLPLGVTGFLSQASLVVSMAAVRDGPDADRKENMRQLGPE